MYLFANFAGVTILAALVFDVVIILLMAMVVMMYFESILEHGYYSNQLRKQNLVSQ
ncbi:MAG: hypothetical protein MOP48_907 [Nitrososphaera sp.]|nr:hypothetical protein [Nitrososphaera sp.]